MNGIKNKLLLVSIIVAGLFVMAACTNNAENNNTANNTENNSQIANPASKFCVDNGGTLDIRTSGDGSQLGYCKINGEECEEWALFRGECSNVHVCTDAEKAAELCTLEYMPVCGSDSKTYGNKCNACAAKVDYWTQGECGYLCEDCPVMTPPSPDFCPNGTIISGGKNKCGCNLAPICQN